MVTKSQRVFTIWKIVLFLGLFVIIIALIMFIYNPLTSSYKTNETSKVIEVEKEVENIYNYVKKYGLSVAEITDLKLVLNDNEYDCIIYIYPEANLSFVLEYNQKNYYPKIVYKNVLSDREEYILLNENLMLYRLLIGYRYPIDEFNNYIIYVTTCGNFERTKDFHYKIADDLVNAYKKYILRK